VQKPGTDVSLVDDPVGWLKAFNEGNDSGFASDLRDHISSGTFDERRWVKTRARIELWRTERRIRAAFAETPEGIALRQVRAAENSATAAYIAIGVSLVSLGISVAAFFKA